MTVSETSTLTCTSLRCKTLLYSMIFKTTCPSTMKDWKHPSDHVLGGEHWNYYRQFFRQKGYILYVQPYSGAPGVFPADDPAGKKLIVYQFNAWPARKNGADYWIKVLHHGKFEDCHEARILSKLFSLPLRSDPANPLVPFIEFLQCDDWIFTVTEAYEDSIDPPLTIVHDSVDFGLQILQGLDWLHRHGVAHLDIAHENILVKTTSRSDGSKERKYRFIDFGCSQNYEPGQERKANLFYNPQTGRENKAPELEIQVPYDPFSADVYAIGILMLSILYPLTEFTPMFLPLIRSMTHLDPQSRLSASDALVQFKAVMKSINPEQRSQERKFTWYAYLSLREDGPPDEELGDNIRKWAHEREQEIESALACARDL